MKENERERRVAKYQRKSKRAHAKRRKVEKEREKGLSTLL